MRFRSLLLALAMPLLPLPLAGCGAGGIDSLVDDFQDEVGGGAGGPETPALTMTEEERAMALDCFDRVNEERARAGVGALAWREDLTDAAFGHSDDMSVRDFFDHVNPDGEAPGDRIDEEGVDWSRCAENIAMGYPDAEDVMEGWMASEGHRDNLLDPGFTDVGIGVRRGPGGPYWTQDFVRR